MRDPFSKGAKKSLELALRQALSLHDSALGSEHLVLGLGALGTVFVLLRVFSVPDSVLPADSRGIGLWIALAAALGVIAGGLLRAAEDL